MDRITGTGLVAFIIVVLLNDACGKSKTVQDHGEEIKKCFEMTANHWLIGYATKVSTVKLENECPRQCLEAQVKDNFVCKSAVYLAEDHTCILSTEDRHSQPDIFIESHNDSRSPVHYYQNLCTWSSMKRAIKDDAIAARSLFTIGKYLKGYMEFVQNMKDGQITFTGILTDLKPGANFTADISKLEKITPCEKIRRWKEHSQGENTLLSAEFYRMNADATGMVVITPRKLTANIRPLQNLLRLRRKLHCPLNCQPLKGEGWQVAITRTLNNLNVLMACLQESDKTKMKS
ncbi:unnamed protein product [Soboliphyme baturini]|uniref:Apple domain-containing protein n=1 Tax=Soboliphyme baturini TaxID=241478 RepID=A0A183IN87_9BILA|nr:unnamed protein product [Soboliphyme baturini]